MKDETENPYAFPQPYEEGYSREMSQGMTLRDYFAAKAMQGEIGTANYQTSEMNPKDIFEHISMRAYQIADAMLKARNNKN